jgi:hypothetical protein
VRNAVPVTCLLSLGVTLAGCEPASVTAARDQLSRGADRTVELTLPIAVDTFWVDSLFGDWLTVPTTTILDGLLAVVASSQDIVIPAGDSACAALACPGGTFTGVLDPAVLNFPIEEFQEFTAAGLNLEDFEDAARDATINAALMVLTVSNDSADAPVAVADFQLGVVQIDPGTGLPRRVGGLLDWETDGGGAPILVDVPAPGDTLFIAAADSAPPVVDTVAASALVDRLVDLLLDSTRATIVGVGTALVGDGGVGTVSSTDQLTVSIELLIGLDFTIPPAGVSFDESTAREGLDLDTATVDDITSRVDSAVASLLVVNATPFGVEAAIEVVGDSVDDAFAEPPASRVPLDTISVPPATVDGNGRVLTASLDTASVHLTGDDVRPFLGEFFTAGVRIRLFPPNGGRGAVRATDRIIVAVQATFYVRTGGGQ